MSYLAHPWLIHKISWLVPKPKLLLYSCNNYYYYYTFTSYVCQVNREYTIQLILIVQVIFSEDYMQWTLAPNIHTCTCTCALCLRHETDAVHVASSSLMILVSTHTSAAMLMSCSCIGKPQFQLDVSPRFAATNARTSL